MINLSDLIFYVLLFMSFGFVMGYMVGKFAEYRKNEKNVEALKDNLQQNKHHISGKYILNHHNKQTDHYWDGCWEALNFCIERVNYYVG